MIESALANYLATKTALTNLLPQQPKLGNSRAASIFVRQPIQSAVAPYVLISPTDIDDYGNTSGGVLTRKGGYFTIAVCGLVNSAELQPINFAVLAQIEPIRQMWLPSISDANKIWCQYANIARNFFHDGSNAQGNELGLPSWKTIINTAFSRP